MTTGPSDQETPAVSQQLVGHTTIVPIRFMKPQAGAVEYYAANGLSFRGQTEKVTGAHRSPRSRMRLGLGPPAACPDVQGRTSSRGNGIMQWPSIALTLGNKPLLLIVDEGGGGGGIVVSERRLEQKREANRQLRGSETAEETDV
ncbi:hypothetical protein HPB48_006815 [Haemaphysalis longicornis]|uniref:Uncharacterized protein n=1 Tax=Haemaphysalis longicornis TaxID=44386 RepID=A0A9J6FEB4_HAELO|nr:hypothetical protein HPB48_006815 [Haemaphysalis longicornis]